MCENEQMSLQPRVLEPKRPPAALPSHQRMSEGAAATKTCHWQHRAGQTPSACLRTSVQGSSDLIRPAPVHSPNKFNFSFLVRSS